MRIRTGLLAALAALSLCACNEISGANDITFGDGPSGSGGPTPTGVLADGISITAISLYQGVRRPLMESGAASPSTLPVTAGREALIRIFYTLDPSFNGKPVTAVVTIGEQTASAEVTPGAAPSTEADLNSTINVKVSGELMVELPDYRVDLLQEPADATGENTAAGYPAEGQELLPANSVGPKMEVLLVPVVWAADGSNRMPDTSESQLQRFHDLFYGLFPAVKVEITVTTETVTWNQALDGGGNGWDALLQALVDLRAAGNYPPTAHMYGLFQPTADFGAFCGGGCQAGLSHVAGAQDPLGRVGIGLGYPREGTVETAAHEVGHQHGRTHAPCGNAANIDMNYPYPDGSIGEWGYDIVSGTLVEPTTTMDFMSYCDPSWVSDYTFQAMWNRMRTANVTNDWHVPDDVHIGLYHRVTVAPDGSLRWQEPLDLKTPPMAETTSVTVDTDEGPVELVGHFYPYDHMAGGMLLFPETAL